MRGNGMESGNMESGNICVASGERVGHNIGPSQLVLNCEIEAQMFAYPMMLRYSREALIQDELQRLMIRTTSAADDPCGLRTADRRGTDANVVLLAQVQLAHARRKRGRGGAVEAHG